MSDCRALPNWGFSASPKLRRVRFAPDPLRHAPFYCLLMPVRTGIVQEECCFQSKLQIASAHKGVSESIQIQQDYESGICRKRNGFRFMDLTSVRVSNSALVRIEICAASYSSQRGKSHSHIEVCVNTYRTQRSGGSKWLQKQAYFWAGSYRTLRDVGRPVPARYMNPP